MQVSNLKARQRDALGKNHVARLRESGMVPGIVYGGDQQPVNVAMDYGELKQELRKHHRVFQLEIEGKTEPVYVQDVQIDCTTDEALHIDFRRIDIREPMQIVIELVFVGHPKGASRGGILIRDLMRLPVKALPLSVPYEIEVPVAEVDLGDKVFAKDLVPPEGVTLECPPDTQLCHMPGEVRLPEEEQPTEEVPPAEGDQPAKE